MDRHDDNSFLLFDNRSVTFLKYTKSLELLLFISSKLILDILTFSSTLKLVINNSTAPSTVLGRIGSFLK